jgi:flagellar biosynthesis anti-sigma factor FlgM
MRIVDSYSTVATDPIGTSPSPPSSGGVGAARAQVPSESQAAVKVNVSAKARALADAQGPGDVDDVKVARLRSAVEAGSFKVDSAKIAARIIEGE